MSAVRSGIRKELLILSNDPAALIMLFILPSIFILVLSLAMQGAFAEKTGREKFEILVVNKDKGDFGAKLMENIEANGYFKVVEEKSFQEAEKAVRQGNYSLLITIPKDATNALTHGGEKDIVMYQDPAFPEDMAHNVMSGIRQFILTTLLDKIKDGSQKQADAIEKLEKHVDKLAARLKDSALTISDLEKKFASMSRAVGIPSKLPAKTEKSNDAENETDSEFEIEEPEDIPDSQGLQVSQQYVKGSNSKALKPSAVQQNVPGWTIFALFWIAQVLAINIISERQSGAYRRIMAAPVSFSTYLMSKAFPFFIINLMQATFLFLIGVYLLPHFGCTKLEIVNIPALALLTVSVSAAAVCFGLLLAGFLTTPFAAASISASILIVMTAVAGIMVPKFVMPETMQNLSRYIPQGIALEGYLDVLLRGKSISELFPAIGRLLGFAAFFATIGVLRMRKIN